MSDDYLWDRSGPPDPEVEALERALAPYRWQGARGDWKAQLEEPAAVRRSRWRWPALAAAAALLLALGIWKLQPDQGGTQAAAPYHLEVLAGAPAVEGDGDGGLRVGQRLVTDASARARLVVGEVGSVVLEPDSSMRLEQPVSPDAGYQLYLERGSLTASIFAAPRLFQVGTPSGMAVDLGCVYTATVQEDGGALLRVVSGRVSFESDGRQALVPAGASVRAYPDAGPGTPVWDDAPEAWRQAVEFLDHPLQVKGAESGMEEALQIVLTTEREKDSLSLWHLLQSSEPIVRESVYDRLAVLSPPPPGVLRAACLAGDSLQLASWRASLSWN